MLQNIRGAVSIRVSTVGRALSRYFQRKSAQAGALLVRLDEYIRENAVVIGSLAVVALLTYGFALFNFVITIDSEKLALGGIPAISWTAVGRWGMDILQQLLFPYFLIPTVPLFVALVFHIVGVLLILDAWRVSSRLERSVVGAIMITFPTLAYVYAFAVLNYGIGIGFFCVGLSLFLFGSGTRSNRLFAILPGVFALAIYQAFALVLVAAYVVHLMLVTEPAGRAMHSAGAAALVNAAALAIYAAVWGVWQQLAHLQLSPYWSSQYLALGYLLDHPVTVVSSVGAAMFEHYSGAIDIYGIHMRGLAPLLLASLFGLLVNVILDRRPAALGAFRVLGGLVLLALPFPLALLSRGVADGRTLLALPISVAGLVLLGLLRKPGIVRIGFLSLALFCLFEFAVSTNRMFSSAYLALQADRGLSVRLMQAIDVAKERSGIWQPKYLEVVGVLTPPNTAAIFRKTYPFGDSFFEFSFGVNDRIGDFLQISGYQALLPLSVPRRAQLVETANAMSAWPRDGSVRIVGGDIVLVKFGDYSAAQRAFICSGLSAGSVKQLLPVGFCP